MANKKIDINDSVGSIDSIVADLLKNVPAQDSIEIQLPGRFSFYKYTRPDKKVFIRPIKFADEKAVASLKDKREMLNTFLQRCVDGIDLNTILLNDKIFLIVKLRSITVSPSYSFSVTCANNSCRKQSLVDVNLDTDFEVKYSTDELKLNEELDLPISKLKVVIKRMLANDIKGDGSDIIQNLWRFVVSVNGHSNSAIISKVLDELPREDVAEIIKAISPRDFGLQTKFLFKCPDCGHEFVTELVLDEDFFSTT